MSGECTLNEQQIVQMEESDKIQLDVLNNTAALPQIHFKNITTLLITVQAKPGKN